jgi:hypothetical protein
LNAGVIGTGTGEQALWYDVWVKSFKPSVVVLTVFWNDVDDDVRGGFFERAGESVRPRPFDVLERGLSSVRRTRAIANHTPGFAWLSQHSQLLSWIRQGPTEWLVASHARAVGAGRDDLADNPSAALSPEDLALLRGEVRWLCDKLPPSTRLVLVFLPSAETFDDTRAGAGVVVAKSRAIVETLRQVSEETGTAFLDVSDELARRSRPRDLYFALDPHPNPEGYRVIGEEVGAFLASRIP